MEKLIFDLQRFAEGPESKEAEVTQDHSTDTSANHDVSDSFIGK